MTSRNELESASKSYTKCKITKQLELFHKDKSKKDGRSSTCKECWNTPVNDSVFKTINRLHLLCTKCNRMINKAYKYSHEKTTKHKNECTS